jgi:MATE family multidrug resistance protein
MDGFAYAGEALGGRFYGARNTAAFRELLRQLFLWAASIPLAYTLLYIWGGTWIIGILSD